MAQAITRPIHTQASPAHRQEPHPVPLQERVSVLETRAESTATRADVRGAENRMILWILGAALALAALLVPIITSNAVRTDEQVSKLDTTLNARIDKLDTTLNARIDKLDSRIDKLDSRIDKLDSRIDEAMAEIKAESRAMNARMDRLDAKIDARFDALMAELRAGRRSGQ